MYIGNTPAENYASFLTETFTVSATTNYTLSHAVTNENDIRLVINGVVQQPGSGKAYTASGTTLTLTSATVSGDSMYAVYLGRALQTVNPPNASVGTAQLGSEAVTNAKVASTVITGQTAETSIATDDLILLSDTSASGALRKMTRANFVSGIGGTNTPAFEAYSASDQAVSSDQTTKIVFGTEAYDSDGKFASSRFTPTVAGKYYIYSSVQTRTGLNGFQYAEMFIYKNGSSYKTTMKDNRENFAGYYNNVEIDAIMDLDDNDYVEIYVTLSYVANFQNAAGYKSSVKSTYFGGYKLIT